MSLKELTRVNSSDDYTRLVVKNMTHVVFDTDEYNFKNMNAPDKIDRENFDRNNRKKGEAIYKLPLFARMLLTPDRDVLTIDTDFMSSKTGFQYFFEENGNDLTEMLLEVPYAFVNIYGHTSICSYDKKNKALVFMNAFYDIPTLQDYFPGMATVCRAQDGGPIEYCLAGLEDKIQDNTSKKKLQKILSSMGTIENAEEYFKNRPTSGGDKNTVTSASFIQNKESMFSGMDIEMLVPEDESTLENWLAWYDTSRENAQNWEETRLKKIAEEKERREKVTKFHLKMAIRRYHQENIHHSPMISEEEALANDEIMAIFEEMEHKYDKKKEPITSASATASDLEEEHYNVLETSYGLNYAVCMYLVSRLRQRMPSVQVRILQGFQDQDEKSDNHKGCQTLVWLIAAFIESDKFKNDDSLTASQIDLYAPANQDKLLMVALSKFAMEVTRLTRVCIKECIPFYQDFKKRNEGLDDALSNERQKMRNEIKQEKDRKIINQKRKNHRSKEKDFGLAVQKMETTLNTRLTSIALKYKKQLTDFVASELFVISDEVVGAPVGFSVTHRIRLNSFQ